MALGTPTLEAYARSSANVLSLATSSFTPTANSVLIAFSNFTIQTGTDWTGSLSIADSGGLTWTPIALKSSSPLSYGANMGAWRAEVGSSPSARTVTASIAYTGAATYACGLDVISLTGYNTSSIIGLAETFNRGTGYPNNTTGDGPWSLTLAGSPASTSYLLAAIVADSAFAAGIVAGSGWTDVSNPGNHPANQQVQSRTGTTSQNVAWTDTAESGGAYYNLAIVVEIKEAGGGGGGGGNPWYYYAQQ